MAQAAPKPLAPFISLEGGEGVGKTTQQRLLAERVKEMGLPVLSTLEPGDTGLGLKLRTMLAEGGLDPKAELMLFLADRAQHVARVILPALQEGAVVVCDRFADSSEVYQGRVRGLGWGQVRASNLWVCGPAWPDLTLLLDLDPETGLMRVLRRQGSLGLDLDAMEREGFVFHRKLRQGFLDQAAAEPNRIKLVDASRPAEEVGMQIWGLVKPLLQSWQEQVS